MLSEGEDKRCQALRQQDLIETSRSKASPAGKALQEGKGARGFKALGKREASGALPSPLPRPLPRPPPHELHTVLAGFRAEKDALDGGQRPPLTPGPDQCGDRNSVG